MGYMIELCQKSESENGKKYRKRMRAIKKGFDDKNIEKEGEMYGCGQF